MAVMGLIFRTDVVHHRKLRVYHQSKGDHERLVGDTEVCVG